jgi:hypothetical protein
MRLISPTEFVIINCFGLMRSAAPLVLFASADNGIAATTSIE